MNGFIKRKWCHGPKGGFTYLPSYDLYYDNFSTTISYKYSNISWFFNYELNNKSLSINKKIFYFVTSRYDYYIGSVGNLVIKN